MKAIVFQLLASGLALGVMGGSVGIHWLHLSGAKEMSEDPARAGMSRAQELPVISAVSSDREIGSVQPMDDDRAKATVDAFEEVISRLQELKMENAHLHEQLLETNRDLTEIELRLDMHSDEFRPMKVSPGASPLRQEGGAAHPLLPPK